LVGLCQVDDLVERGVGYASGPQGIDLALWDESSPSAIACFIIMLRACKHDTRCPDEPWKSGGPTSITREP